jgi:hypothetical protein
MGTLLKMRWRMMAWLVFSVYMGLVALSLVSVCAADSSSRSETSYDNSHAGHNH